MLVFWVDLKTQKCPFKIKWPLGNVLVNHFYINVLASILAKLYVCNQIWFETLNFLNCSHYLTTPWESIDCKFDSTRCSPTILAVISSQPMDFSISTLNSVRSRWLILTQFSTPLSFPEVLVIVLKLLSPFLIKQTPVAPTRIPQMVQLTDFLSMTVWTNHFIQIHLIFWHNSDRIMVESRRNHCRIQTESGRNSNEIFFRILWGYAKFGLEKKKTTEFEWILGASCYFLFSTVRILDTFHRKSRWTKIN